MIFRDRVEAGRKLGEILVSKVRDIDVVVGLPKGGIICASEVAKTLQKPMAIVLVRRVRHPHSLDYTVGAVADKDVVVKKCEAAVIDSNWLEEEIDKQKSEILRQKNLYLANRPNVSLKGKSVVIVDDGLDTEVIMLAALEYLKKHDPKEVHIAVPVTSSAVLSGLDGKIHSKTTLHDDPAFTSIGNYYKTYNEVSDEQILNILQNNG